MLYIFLSHSPLFTHVGCAAVHRGDVIRCTVVFEDKQEIDGKFQVPVMFSENGSRVIPKGGHPYIECSPNKPLYPYIAFRYENSVLAKVNILTLLSKGTCAVEPSNM